MPLKILATGDLHIGRSASRTAENDHYSAADTWFSLVRQAIDLEVDLVILSGDVIDHANRFYEATGPLERGLQQLADAKITTYAVAGNHDWDVLPRVAAHIDSDSFHLLGKQGIWEEVFHGAAGAPLLRIVGWSFPSNYHDASPLDDFPAGSDPSVPTLGILHADLDAMESRYAPVSTRALQSKGVGFWVLGHIHSPKLIEEEACPPILYPGSPLAMDPGETGVHGPWLIEVDDLHHFSSRQIALSPVRYESREVDLTAAGNDEDFESAIQNVAASACKEIAATSNAVKHLILRLSLTGASPLCGRASSLARQLESERLERSFSDMTCIVDRVIDNTRPAVDLASLAARKDPPGMLATLLLSLESDIADPALEPLLQQAVEALRSIHQKGAFSLIASEGEPSIEEARQFLRREGIHLLETLRAQVPQSEGPLA